MGFKTEDTIDSHQLCILMAEMFLQYSQIQFLHQDMHALYCFGMKLKENVSKYLQTNYINVLVSLS